MLTLIAVLPILLLLFVMVVLEKPAYIAAPITLAVTSILALSFWRMDVSWFNASLVRGALISLEIIFIVIGAFLLITVLRRGSAFSHIKYGISMISKDVRIQVILLAWFFVGFIEGVSGFGTPAMIIAPLMVAMGFTPLASVVATLIGDGVSVSYGAVGIPMTIGIGQGVSPEQAMLIGPEYISQTYIATSLLHLVVGMCIPLVILIILTRIYRKPLMYALEMWKVAIVAGLLFVVPSFFVAYFVGPEFPSVIGSLVGGFVFIVLLKKNMLPRPAHHWQFEHEAESTEKQIERSLHDYAKALIPYLLILLLLIVSRINVWSVGDILKQVQFSSVALFGTTLEYTLYPLYSPGFFFLIAAIVGFMIYRLSRNHVTEIVSEVSMKIAKTFIALIAVLGIVQIIINTGYNTLGLPSFAGQLVTILTKTGFFWPLVSPFVGLFGAFIAGSSTISNLLFSSIQVETALVLGVSPILVLALQAIGSAAGNMIAVHNVIAAASVVHLEHAEGKVIRYTILPALGYALLAGSVILIISIF